MLYQIALELHKVMTQIQNVPTTENVRILNQMIFTRRQLFFEVFRSNQSKIGLNASENKFYHINKQIPLNTLNFTFVHCKKLMKMLFLKYGKT